MFGGMQAAAPANPNAAAPANPNGDLLVQNGPTDGISCVKWSPVANLLIAGSWDNQIRCWDVQATGATVPKAAQQFDAPILTCAWSNDGTRVFAGGCDKQAKCWDLGSNQVIQVGAHAEPVRYMFWLQEINCLVTGSWDKTIKYWDLRAPTPQCTVTLSERVYCMDATHPLLTVGTADRKISVFDMQNPQVPFRELESPLKYQSRCIANFADKSGFCLGSVEGRVAVQHVEQANAQKNFAFKCHRDNTTNDIWAVNSIAFHPKYGTFATMGADGSYNFWDKDNRQRLKEFKKLNTPITCGAFNYDGNIFAYAGSYDWSKGSEHYSVKQNNIWLHAVQEKEVKPNPQVPQPRRR
ncbi:rae1-like protein [Pavlovales sp. CCMP2436]|nr:rae1-like protein [Pavlovales sp. CCMP2436]